MKSHDISEENGPKLPKACDRGMSSKDEPLFLGCSTQGFNRDCYLIKIDYAKKVINGEIDDSFYRLFFEQDSEKFGKSGKSKPFIRTALKTAKLGAWYAQSAARQRQRAFTCWPRTLTFRSRTRKRGCWRITTIRPPTLSLNNSGK